MGGGRDTMRRGSRPARREQLAAHRPASPSGPPRPSLWPDSTPSYRCISPHSRVPARAHAGACSRRQRGTLTWYAYPTLTGSAPCSCARATTASSSSRLSGCASARGRHSCVPDQFTSSWSSSPSASSAPAAGAAGARPRCSRMAADAPRPTAPAAEALARVRRARLAGRSARGGRRRRLHGRLDALAAVARGRSLEAASYSKVASAAVGRALTPAPPLSCAAWRKHSAAACAAGVRCEPCAPSRDSARQ